MSSAGLVVRAVLAERGVDVEFAVAPGEVLAVLGPNGSGKSTVLHVVAGLLRPDDGRVVLTDRVLTDVGAGIQVPTYDRRVGLLLQRPLLFPHLSVAGNVAFAPRSNRAGRAGARATAQHWLAAVGATELARRRPEALSGGQAQRVAIARALAAEPDALLLDEPFAGLDVAAAAAVRSVLRRVLADTARPAILVTHDVVDVLTLADRVLVLETGRIAEHGPVTEVLTRPRSAFGARIAGLNLVPGTLTRTGALAGPGDQVWHGVPAGDLADPGAAAVAVFAPAAVSVFAEPPVGSPRNVVAVTVTEVDAVGSALRVRAEPLDAPELTVAADITAEAAADLRLVPGARAWFAVKAQEVALHGAHRQTGHTS